MPKQIDTSFLEMALVGYRAELHKIEASMSAIRKQLGVRGSSRVPRVARMETVKHHMTAAGRKHIAEAQHKRWAAYRAKHKTPAKAAKAAASKPTTAKKKLSPERKAALAANLAKARAAKAAKKPQASAALA